ncbi:MAG: hypothetical protein LBP86_00220 [Azoarcus sp.]|nr:hypothetical protein [Azoarcus sp.]
MEAIMVVVMDMENGGILRAPAGVADIPARQSPVRPPQPWLQPQQRLREALQDVCFSPVAACLPPPLDIVALLAAFDA